MWHILHLVNTAGVQDLKSWYISAKSCRGVEGKGELRWIMKSNLVEGLKGCKVPFTCSERWLKDEKAGMGGKMSSFIGWLRSGSDRGDPSKPKGRLGEAEGTSFSRSQMSCLTSGSATRPDARFEPHSPAFLPWPPIYLTAGRPQTRSWPREKTRSLSAIQMLKWPKSAFR